jgi:hypothetical protein|uniref:C2H2-type domain-containing protein n=1 Tax=viral metagenome TaxID=1070528 RepID=A0A6C0CXL3_9ZZZZ
MGKMLIKNPKKSNKKFFCESCSFECSNKKDFNRHLSTTKHQRLMTANGWLMEKTPHDNTSHNINTIIDSLPLVNNSKKTPYDKSSQNKILENNLLSIQSEIFDKKNGVKTPDYYECENCKKVYAHLSSLCKHKKICLDYESEICEITEQQIATLPKEKESEFKELVLLLLKENKEIQKNFMELIPHIKGNITSNSHNTTTNNNQFNINMFLNEHCKNAMNLTDFINSLPITNETYDHTIENGLTKTITHMITNGLNNMDILERPIHCTDPARKTMYVKDNDVWEKDNELVKVLEGIKVLSLKQRTNISKWQDVNPGWKTDENLQTKLTSLVFHSMTDIENDEKECNKIIRAISKNTYLTAEIKNEYMK